MGHCRIQSFSVFWICGSHQWPIRWFDRNVHGGMGIMIDDIVAGVIFRRYPVLYRSSLAAGYSVVVVHQCLM
ncbi:phosphatidylglycerophosphatase A [Escherichia coli]